MLFLAMSSGAALKQSIWVGMVDQAFPVAPAVLVSIYNTVLNTINGVVMLYTTQVRFFTSLPCLPKLIPGLGQNQPELGAYQYAGAALFSAGILIELGSEVQRTLFKKDPENKGKVYTGGLFALSRHVNYFGYTLWRSGFALASGSPVLAGLMASWLTFDFVGRGIPVLDRYCAGRVSACVLVETHGQ
jgi:steroid 5-alpha reductase family enzyme